MSYYSVILLDDEELIIQSLRKTISWSDLNCYIRASANNGKRGKELIDQSCPDILIADIKMPGLSGLELAEYCAQYHPKCKVIIVSAYADFDFARKAIKAGIIDYLLKPINKQDLTAAIRKAIADIQKQEETAMRMERERANLENVRTLAEDSILFNLARYGTAGIKGEMFRYAADRARHAGVVIMIEFFNLTQKHMTVMAAGQGLYGTGLLNDGYHPAFGSADEKVVMICPLKKNYDYTTARSRIMETLRRIQRSAPEEIGLNVICVSDVYRNEEELQQSYRQCITMSDQAYFCKDSAVLEAVERDRESGAELNTEILVQALKNGQDTVVRDFFASWRKRLCGHRDKQLAMTKIRELQRETTLCASRMDMNTADLWKHRFESENFDARYQVLEDGAGAVCAFAQGMANPVSRCVLYMEDHYAEHDLNLEKIAQAVQVSSSYLSRAFKKKYNVNFTEYLTSIRIEHARKLLETSNRKAYEIADQIGYDDAHYFSQVFKKKVGMSPLEYRRKHARGQKITM